MAQAASDSCEICEGGTGRHYCQQCDQIFCDNCKNSHLRIKTTKNHTFLNERIVNLNEKPFCSEHDEPFIFHCVDCDIVVCQICAVKKHNRHNMSSLKESVLKLKGQLENVVESKSTALRNDIQQIKQGSKVYQSDAQVVIKLITEDATRMKYLIDAKAEALIKSVKGNEVRNCEILSTDYSKCMDIFNKINKVKKTITDTNNMSDVAWLPKIKQLQAQIDRMETKKVPGMPTFKYSRKKISQKDIENLFGRVSYRDTISDQEAIRQQSGQCEEQYDYNYYHDNWQQETEEEQYRYDDYKQYPDMTKEDLYGYGYRQETDEED